MSDIESEIICPACGSTSVKYTRKDKDISVPYSNVKTISITEYICSTCGATGDFVGDNDAVLEGALKSANKEAIHNILQYLNSLNISMAAIERALELPQRMLTKWKNDLTGQSAAGVALMKMVRTFPWLLDVAENKYDAVISQRIFITQAVNDLLSHAAVQGMVVTETGMVEKGGYVWCYARFSDKAGQVKCLPGNVEVLTSMTGGYSGNQLTTFEARG